MGAAVFGLSMFLLYLASSIYHALPPGKAKGIFLILDHCAIYLLIAGTYTPFTLGILRGSWGWSLFGAVWGLATLGIIFKSIYGLRYPNLSTGLYLVMGLAGATSHQTHFNLDAPTRLIVAFSGRHSLHFGCDLFCT